MRGILSVTVGKAAYRECDVGELDSCASSRTLRGPVLVDIETVRGASRDEVLELDVPDVARAKVALDHKRLVASVGIDVPTASIRDGVR